jgi:tol-pal system protein YbgF
MKHYRTVIGVMALGTALLGSSYLWANPPIERAEPIFIGSSGGALADGVTQEEFQRFQQTLPDQFATQATVLQLTARLQQMEQEIQQLRNANEQLQEQLRRVEQDARDRYIELDRRLRADVGGTSMAPAQTQGSSDDSDDQAATRAYRVARDLMTERRYEEAASGFEQFITDFPTSGLLADAWFWLGEVRLLLRENAQAEAAYQRVLADFPASDKRADALFKLGFLAERQGQRDQARDYYQQVLGESANGSLADLARQRLQGL